MGSDTEIKKGHAMLMHDLLLLVSRAARLDYHDFKSSEATPKSDLVEILDRYLRKAKSGWYDDEPDEEDKADLEKMMEEHQMPEMMRELIRGKKTV